MSDLPAHAPIEVAAIVQDLAEKGCSKKQILKTLEEQDMADVLDFLELQNAMEKGKLMRGMIPQGKTHTLTRTVGLIAILLGVGAILFSLHSTDLGSRSMIRYGVFATILGLILVCKPDSGEDDI